MKRKILFVLLAVLVCMTVFAAAAFATEESTATVVSTGEQLQPNSTEVDYSWSLDSNGVLTIKSEKDATIDTDTTRTAFAEWHATWRSSVKHIVIATDCGLHTLYAKSGISMLADYPNLVSIDLGNIYRIHLNGATPRSGIFQKDTALTTVYSTSKGIEKVDGVINLSSVNRIQGWGHGNGSLFAGCTSITNVIFYKTTSANGIFTLGANAFDGCTKLQSVSLASDITSIDASAFNGCTALTSVEIPATVTSIGKNAFAGCTSLESVTFTGMDAESLTIDSTAFAGSTATFNVVGDEMKALLISAGITEENINAVTIVSSGSQVNPKDETDVYFTWELDYKGTLTFKHGSSRYISSTGDQTAYNAWRTQTTGGVENQDLVKKMVFSDGIYRIVSRNASQILSGYDNLTTIELGKGVFLIQNSWTGGYLFDENPSLTTVTSADHPELNAEGTVNLLGITSLIDDRDLNHMFSGCSGIKKILFADTNDGVNDASGYYLPIFGSYAFNGCTGLESVNIPAWVTTVSANAFAGCTALKSIVIPANVTAIGASAFATSGLESISFEGTDASALNIDSTAFANAASLKATALSEDMKTLLVEELGFTAENVSVNVGGGAGDFTWEIENGVLTVSGSGTALTFGSEITAETLSDIPWSAYSAQITSVVLDAEVTSLCDYAFAGLVNCESIVIPASLTDLGASAVFYGDLALESVTVSGKEAAEGVIDLFNATAVSADLFDGAEISASVYLPKLTDTSFLAEWAEDMTALTVVTYPTCDLASAVRANKDISLGYLPESYDPMLRRVGNVQSSGKNVVKYSFDEATATLTYSKPDDATSSGRYVLYFGDGEDQVNKQPTADGIAAWKAVWADAVEHIYVGSFTANQVGMQNNHSPFSNFPNLVNVHFSFSTVRFTAAWVKSGLFENCSSLTTVSFGSDAAVDGVIDLSFWENQDRTITKMFKNCSSITKIIFPEDLVNAYPTDAGNAAYAIGFGAEMFYGCTALTEIFIPDIFTVIGKDAFRGCTNLKKVVIENADCDVSALTSNSFPKTAVIDTFSADIAAALTGLGFTVRDLDGVLNTEGFQIRLEDYNGLRGIFYFDEKKNETVEGYGYTLKEYGVMITPATEYDYWGGIDIKCIKGEYVTLSSTIKKMPVYKNGAFVGKILPTTEFGTRVDFAGSVIKYASNFKTDVYIGAYAVYTDASGNYYLVKEVYSDSEGNNFFNLYDITLGMLANGAESGILTMDMDEVSVWNTVLQGADTEIYETAVGGYDGITVTLAKAASDSDTYIPFIRSEKGAEITDEAVSAAEALLAGVSYTLGETVCLTIADQGTAPSVDKGSRVLNPLVTTPNRYNKADDKAEHCQGMCTDGTHIYYSFTGKIVKVRMSDGVEVGTMTISDDLDQFHPHIGNLISHGGKLYGSLGFWYADKSYILSVDTNDIVGDVWSNDVMKATYYAEDGAITLFEGTENEAADSFSGGEAMLDSITVGKIPGGGFILPDGREINDNNYYLVFGAGSAYKHSTKRHDDDYLRLRFVDIKEVDDNAALIDIERIESEEDYITKKYVVYAYAGSTCVQVISYDKDTGDYHFATYGRDVGLDDTYPNYDYFVVDGSKKPRLEELYLGQNTPEDSEVYEISIERAAQLKDKNDLDGDGITDEPMLGFVADLVCVCRKQDIDAHEAIDYDNSGHAGKICGMYHPAMADQGLISMGGDYFYAAYYNNAVIDGVTYQGEDARLYRLHRYNGAWNFVRIN